MPHYDSMAQDALSKAVKMNPKLVEAWNCLGECYWKNGEVEAARNCFVGALNHVSNFSRAWPGGGERQVCLTTQFPVHHTLSSCPSLVAAVSCTFSLAKHYAMLHFVNSDFSRLSHWKTYIPSSFSCLLLTSHPVYSWVSVPVSSPLVSPLPPPNEAVFSP